MAHVERHLPRWTRRERLQFLSKRRGNRWALACAALLAMPIVLACMPVTTTVISFPANQLHLGVTITNQYAATPEVLVNTQLSPPNPSRTYVIKTPHTLTCNGVPVIAGTFLSGSALVPRQPPGGAYIFAYSDERSQPATLIVSVPLVRFVVTSPTANSSVPIPGQGSAQTYLPTPTVTVPQSGRTPNTIRIGNTAPLPALAVRYTMPALATGVSATARVTAVCDRTYQTACGGIAGPAMNATGIYWIADEGPYGFDHFIPGPGEVYVIFEMNWSIPGSGFAAADVRFHDQLSILVTWTR